MVQSLLMQVPSPLRRELLTISSEPSMTTLRRSTFLIERTETLLLLSQTRINLMPALRATKIELHGRRINLREVRTKTDSEKLTITHPKRPPRSSPAMTREKEETADFSKPLHPCDQDSFDPIAKSIKLKYCYIFI